MVWRRQVQGPGSGPAPVPILGSGSYAARPQHTGPRNVPLPSMCAKYRDFGVPESRAKSAKFSRWGLRVVSCGGRSLFVRAA